jgi:succinylglutamate desuccinylase
MSKILIIGSTHGHERIGLLVQNELKKLGISHELLAFEVGNPKASEKNVPFIESDLNRVFPGKDDGTYEERRAHELSPKIQASDLVIDIHSTNTTDLSPNSMLIVTKYDEATKEITELINPPTLLVMKYKNGNALISQAKVGIAFEYGKDNSRQVLEATLHDIGKILVAYGLLNNNPYLSVRTEEGSRVFEVYDAFAKNFEGKYKISAGVENFVLQKEGTLLGVTENDYKIFAPESFVPILFGENRYTEILGFKARQI